MIDLNITKNYIHERKRMCTALKKQDCFRTATIHCSFYNRLKGCIAKSIEEADAERAIKNVQDWSDRNPQKTYLSEFIKHYPNVELDSNGIPNVVWLLCPHHLGLKDIGSCKIDNACEKCWNKPIEEN